MLPKGFVLEHKNGGHIHIIDPDGEIVRDKRTGMPISFSNSPSGGNWENKVRRDIKNNC
jgi:hypothetical protein